MVGDLFLVVALQSTSILPKLFALTGAEARSQEPPGTLSVGVPSLQTRLCADVMGVPPWQAFGRAPGIA